MTGRKVILVTGATGFIGRQVCVELLSKGWRVHALVRDSRSSLPDGASPIPGDMMDRSAIRSATYGVDAIVHLGGRVHVMKERAQDSLYQFRRVNVEGTRILLEEARRNSVRRFVFASSVKAVGESNTTPWTERETPRPIDPYGITKLEAEKLVAAFGASGDLNFTIVRLPLVYGPGMRGNMLRLFRLVDAQIPLPLGSINNRRSLAFSGNVAAAIHCVLESPRAKDQIFFVADREAPSTPELIRAISIGLGKRVALVPIPAQSLRIIASTSESLSRVLPVPSIGPVVHRLIDSLTISIEKISEFIGYNPPYSLVEGLEQTASWFKLESSRSGGS